jgi:hypothetical protein
MIEFSLSIDLGKKERVKPGDQSMPIDRDFVSRSLIALATELQARNSGHGAILDDTGANVGGWKFSLLEPEG